MGRRQRREDRQAERRQIIDRLPVLGVDIGGVLVDRAAEHSDTSFFGDRPMETPIVPGAFEALAFLAGGPFEYRVHLVSKAGPRIAGMSREWLVSKGFFPTTAISPGNLHFVRRRLDKAEVCERLGITHFIDDRLDVLGHLGMVPHRFFFVGGLGENPAPASVPEGVVVAETWPLLVERLLLTLPRE